MAGTEMSLSRCLLNFDQLHKETNDSDSDSSQFKEIWSDATKRFGLLLAYQCMTTFTPLIAQVVITYKYPNQDLR